MQTLYMFQLLLTIIKLAHSRDFVCKLPSTPSASAPSLPNITNQFTTRVEANIENRGYTVTLIEYYDEPNNRGRLDFSRSGRRTLTLIYTYTDNQWFSINGSVCTAHLLSANVPFRGLPVTFDSQGNAHIRGVADILRFGRQYNETYVGREIVRGITADRWRSCMTTRRGGNMSLDWYFAAANWTTTSDGTPVRLVIEGVDPDRSSRSNGSVGSHYFKHSYEFVFFTPGQADNELFQIPHGLFCDGSQVAKNLPPLPNQFFARIQEIDALNNTVREFSEVVDASNQQIWRQNSSVTRVQDFRIGVGFFVSNGNCLSFSLNPHLLKLSPVEDYFAELTPDKKHLQLKSVKTLFGLSKSNVSYIGTRTVNDIPCDVFIEETVDHPQPGNITIRELSFARKSFSFLSSSNAPEHQVPVRSEVYSKNLVGRLLDPPSQGAFHRVFNLYNFEFSPQQSHGHGMGMYTRQCYDSNRNVWFQLDGDVDKLLLTNMDSFIAACTDAVATAAGVDWSRVTGITLSQIGNRILVHTILLGFINNTNITTYVSMGVALNDAITNLKKAVNNGHLQISVPIGGIQTQYSGVKGSVTTDFQTSSNSPSSGYTASEMSPSSGYTANKTSPSSGYTGGEMAGLAIAMVIVGVAIGAVVLFLYMRRKGTLEVPYGKQDNPT